MCSKPFMLKAFPQLPARKDQGAVTFRTWRALVSTEANVKLYTNLTTSLDSKMYTTEPPLPQKKALFTPMHAVPGSVGEMIGLSRLDWLYDSGIFSIFGKINCALSW